MSDLWIGIGWAIVWGTGLCVCLWVGVWGIALILTAQEEAMTRRDRRQDQNPSTTSDRRTGASSSSTVHEVRVSDEAWRRSAAQELRDRPRLLGSSGALAMALPQILKRADGPLHRDQGLAEGTARLGHTLSGPIEVGGRHFVFCRCGWLCSTDDVADVPARCELERLALAFEQDVWMTERIARRERQELDRLLERRTA